MSAEAHDSRMMDLCEGAGAHEFTQLYVCMIYAFANIALALPLSRGACTCAQRIALRAWWLRTGPYSAAGSAPQACAAGSACQACAAGSAPQHHSTHYFVQQWSTGQWMSPKVLQMRLRQQCERQGTQKRAHGRGCCGGRCGRRQCASGQSSQHAVMAELHVEADSAWSSSS